MSRTIGIVPGSFKPYHAGHDALLRIAAEENDIVYLLASTTPRGSASGDTMKQVWNEYILPTLPANVIPDVSEGSPVGKVYKIIQRAEEESSTDIFRIYSDKDDITKYNSKKLCKVAPKLYGSFDNKKQIELRGIPRTATVNVSGTKMREYLLVGDIVRFIENLPGPIQGMGEEIFKKLGGKHNRRVNVKT